MKLMAAFKTGIAFWFLYNCPKRKLPYLVYMEDQKSYKRSLVASFASQMDAYLYVGECDLCLEDPGSYYEKYVEYQTKLRLPRMIVEER